MEFGVPVCGGEGWEGAGYGLPFCYAEAGEILASVREREGGREGAIDLPRLR